MSHVHDDHDYETLGMVPSILMVLAGLLVAIFPGLLQVFLLMAP